MKSCKRWLVSLLLVVLLPLAVVAEGLDLDTTRPISLDFQDTDWENFLRIIAEVSSYNVVMLDQYEGKLTLRLMDQPWGVILRNLTSERGLSLKVTGKVISIYKTAHPLRTSAREYHGKLISLDLQDTQAVNARRIIEEVGSPQEMLPNEAKCKVTLRVIDVPWDQAFELFEEMCARQGS